jgi:membrane-associated phospholipid phosphatase
VFWYSKDFSQGLSWLVSISPFLMFVPVVFFAVAYKLGWVSDLDMSKRDERPTFLFVFIAMLLISSIILYAIKVPLPLFAYAFSGLVMTLVTSIITLFWKISFHTAATASVVTAIAILGGMQFTPLFLLIPLIGWARVRLKKHTVWQVVGGAAVSIVATVFVFYAFGIKII